MQARKRKGGGGKISTATVHSLTWHCSSALQGSIHIDDISQPKFFKSGFKLDSETGYI